MGFIHDACTDGRRFRCLTMVDEYTRECLVVDHGPEFILRALDLRAYRRGLELVFIRPGTPVANAYVESCHSRFRDECLSTHWLRRSRMLAFTSSTGPRTTTRRGPTPALLGGPPVNCPRSYRRRPPSPTLSLTLDLTPQRGEDHAQLP
jgi:putative transposase